jgi:hypothetical protein
MEDEEDIEKLFEEFLMAIKNLPEEDVDKIYDNLQKMDEDTDLDS